MKKFVLIISLIAGMGAVLFAQQQLTVAVSPFDVKNGITADVADVVTELFIAELAKNRTLRVVDRNSFDRIVAEMRFQASDWANSSRVAQMGRALNANSIVRGNVMALAGKTIISAFVLDINTAQIISANIIQLDNNGQIFNSLPQFTQNMVANLTRLSDPVLSYTAPRQYTLVVSSFDIRGGMPTGDVVVLMELITANLVTNGMKVVDRNSFDRIAAEMRFQASDWSDRTRLAQLGRALNANSILRGSIMSLEGRIVVSASILDINTTEVLSSSNLQMSGVGEIYQKLPDFVRPIVTGLPFPSDYKPFVGRWRITYNNFGSDAINKPSSPLEIILNIRDNGTIVVERFDTITYTSDVFYLLGTSIETYGSPNRYGGGTGTYTYTTDRDGFQLNMTLNLTGIISEIPSYQTITTTFRVREPNTLQSTYSSSVRHVYYTTRIALIPIDQGAAINRSNYSRIAN